MLTHIGQVCVGVTTVFSVAIYIHVRYIQRQLEALYDLLREPAPRRSKD